MRLDENENIEIESKEDYEKGVLNDFAFTYNPKQNLYTRDLVHCVGLAFIDEVKGIRKRGLIHVHYNKKFVRDENNNIILPYEKTEETHKILKKFLSDFRQNEEGGKIFRNPEAFVVYVRSVVIDKEIERIVLRSELSGKLREREIEDEDRYENPMADFIMAWLKKRNIDLYASNATSNKKLPSILNMEDDPKEIHHKEFSLGHNQIRVGMYNKEGVLLNKNDYKACLEF